jgi:ABC-type Fe3+/spermidine/putrescine transport system ATPase subunit
MSPNERGAPDRTGHRLDVEGLVKQYGSARAVDDVSLTVPAGRLLTLLGPSGCGKTTIMRSIAGFVRPDAGRVCIDGRDILGVPPERRSTAMLFQSYGLFPHMTVAGNVGFGLRMRRRPRAEIPVRVAAALRLTRIEDLADRYPGQLSGGQQQRVALARAIIIEPDVLLLDEPFGALDQALRGHMQVELRKLQQSISITTLVVTHDQHEAFTLSDLIAVMRAGRIEQIGTPEEIYDRPATRFVAEFVGVENLVAARVERVADGAVDVRAGAIAMRCARGAPLQSGDDAIIAVRADAIVIEPMPGSHEALPARVTYATHQGGAILYELVLADGQVLRAAEARRGDGVRPPGTMVGVRLPPSRCTAVRT